VILTSNSLYNKKDMKKENKSKKIIISDFKCSWHGKQKPVLVCPKCWESIIKHKK